MGSSDLGTRYMTERGVDRELRPWHYIYVYSVHGSKGNPQVGTSRLRRNVRAIAGGTSRPEGAGFRVQGAGFGIQGSGFRVQGSGFRV